MAMAARTLEFQRASSALFVAAWVLSLPAFACEDQIVVVTSDATKTQMLSMPMSEQLLDPPIDLRSDCSFDDVLINGFWSDEDHGYVGTESYLGGGAARDRGEGRVGQRIVDGKGCYSVEKLLVVDCTSGESVLIDGLQPPELADANFVAAKIELIQAPNGPISVNANTRISDLVDAAAQNGLTLTTEVEAFFAKRGKDRFDHTCGCKLFYPGSPGAGGQGG